MRITRWTGVSWLDWKLGVRLLLKHPGLTIIGGLSLASAIAVGAVGIEVADELLYKRLPFDQGDRVVRLDTQDAAASSIEQRVLHDFAVWRRTLKTVVELGAMPDASTEHVADVASPFAERDRLDRALGRLPVDQRAVIVTHFFLGFPISEVAEILGVPDGTAKSRLNRGLRSLRDALAGERDVSINVVPVATP